MAEVINFPPKIRVVIGTGWRNVPFAENDIIELQIEGGISPGWYISYSEDGTDEPNTVSNRLLVLFHAHFTRGTQHYYLNRIIASCSYEYSPSSIYFTSVAGTTIYTTEDYTFKKLFDQNVTCWLWTPYVRGPNFPDYTTGYGFNLSNEPYNPNIFKSIEAVYPPVIKRHYLVNDISNEHFSKVQGLVNSLTFQDKLNLLLSGSGNNNDQILQGGFGETNTFKYINGLGEQGYSILSGALGCDQFQEILLNYGVSNSKLQKLKTSITGNDIKIIQKILSDIAEKNIILKNQHLSNIIGDLLINALYPSVNYDIYLDGKPIKNKINSASITYTQSSIHNTFNFSSSDPNLYILCNPLKKFGESRIEIHVGNRVFYFLLEERSGKHNSFSVWGRSLSAKIDNPYSEEISYSLDDSKSAKSVCEDLAGSIYLDWKINDWILPDDFSFTGVPIEGIVQIANEVGAIVRSDDDGAIIVRDKHPVRPVYMKNSNPVIQYEPNASLIQLSIKENQGSYYDSIEVLGFTKNVETPDLEVEPSPNGSHIKGEDIFIRAYWGIPNPPHDADYYTTDGIVTLIKDKETEIIEENVEFQEGVGRVNRPISDIKSVEWIGKHGGGVTWQDYSNEMLCDTPLYRVAKIKYETVFRRYKVHKHNVNLLVFVLVIESPSDVSVKVISGNGQKEAPGINRHLLTNNSIAIKAGTNWIDSNKYDSKSVTIESPFKNDVKDGILVEIKDSNVDLSGNCQIEGYLIEMDGPRVVNKIDAIQFNI